MRNLLQFVLLALLAATPALAADSAVLRNGFSILHQRRQIIGTVTRLYIDGDQSFVDIPTAEIDHFETLPDPPALRSDPPAAVAAQPFDLTQAVKDASGAYKLDPDLVTSVIRAESGFNVRAVSPKGAQGLMQLMPQTASQLGVHNAFDPQANVEAGTRYLRSLLERYNFDLVKALAAYNAGPQRVEQYNGVPTRPKPMSPASCATSTKRKSPPELFRPAPLKKLPLRNPIQPTRRPRPNSQNRSRKTSCNAGFL